MPRIYAVAQFSRLYISNPATPSLCAFVPPQKANVNLPRICAIAHFSLLYISPQPFFSLCQRYQCFYFKFLLLLLLLLFGLFFQGQGPRNGGVGVGDAEEPGWGGVGVFDILYCPVGFFPCGKFRPIYPGKASRESTQRTMQFMT